MKTSGRRGRRFIAAIGRAGRRTLPALGALLVMGSNSTLLAQYQSTNLYDLRIAFQWPVYANGTIGNGRQSYRTMIGGQLVSNGIGYTFNPTYYQSP